MTDLTLPTQGLTLIHDRTTSKKDQRRQIIQLNLIEGVTKDLLKSLQNNEPVRLRLGARPSVQCGSRTLPLSHGPDSLPSDLLSGPLDATKPMYFTGNFSHVLETRRAQEDTARSDQALATLTSTLKSMKEERAEASIRGKDGGARRGLGVLGTKDRFLNGSNPTSPFLGGRSPASGPTSTPLPSTATNKGKIRQDAIRVPLIHLLAARPMTGQQIRETLRISAEDSEMMVEKVANDNNGQKELKAKFYRDLDVWKFPYKAQEERQSAIDNAIHNFDKLRIDKHDSIWQQLLPPAERGKGKVLSKLNFDKQLAVPKPPVKGGDAKGDASDREGKAKKPRANAERSSTHRKKPSEDNTTTPKLTKTSAKLVARAAAQAKQQESKFKSSERIEDSDAEAEATPVIPSKPPTPLKSKATEPNRPAPKATTSRPPIHKAQTSESRAAASSSTGLQRTRPLNDPLKTKAKLQTDASKPVSRPRNGSSPHKRSPLGSSPPTMSTDLENSSKASSHSSAPSSPPSSTDVPLAQTRRTYSPVINSNHREVPNGSVKRRAEPSGDQPAPKRQQLNGDCVTALPTDLANQVHQAPAEHASSGSTDSSPDETLLSKHTVVSAAKYFCQCYRNYHRLHDRLSQLPLQDRADHDIEALWDLHKQLDQMKTQIWADWEKVGGEP